MSDEHGYDPLRNLYAQTKLTPKEWRTFEAFADLTDDELTVLTDKLFELAILAHNVTL